MPDITEFKTESYIVRERYSGGNWTVEEKDENNVIAEVNTNSNPIYFRHVFQARQSSRNA